MPYAMKYRANNSDFVKYLGGLSVTETFDIGCELLEKQGTVDKIYCSDP